MTEGEENAIKEVLRMYAIPFDEADLEEIANHLSVLLDSLAIYIQRNKQYGDIWGRFGWMDNLHHMRSKLERLWRNLWDLDGPWNEVNEDSAKDLINYTVFCILNGRRENKRG